MTKKQLFSDRINGKIKNPATIIIAAFADMDG
jgi:hypothetical protein